MNRVDHPEQHYTWTWDLRSAAEALWPLVSDTDRFNHDCGLPAVTVLPRADSDTPRYVRHLRARSHGLTIEWQEFAFEWEAPRRFSVDRAYSRGPLKRMVVRVELTPRPTGGTRLVYDVRLTPSGWPGRLAAPFAIGRHAAATFERVFRSYDETAAEGRRQSLLPGRVVLQPGAAARIRDGIRRVTMDHGVDAALAARLEPLLTRTNDLAVARMRPYAWAREWGQSRADTLRLFLCSTRAGLLDFSWDLVCPHCRGSKRAAGSLAELAAEAHCETCGIDFAANFERSVELTFHPSAAIRKVQRPDYCVGGPQLTPHILAQQIVPPRGCRTLHLTRASGEHRVRISADGRAPAHRLRVDEAGDSAVTLTLGETAGEFSLRPGGELTLVNPGAEPQLAVVEQLAWLDLATSASEVTALQVFRDLFSREVLRPGENIQVGTLAVVFTDLKNSTRMYREHGDAPAFGRVLTHFDRVKACIATEGGCVVKTMGDAVMAVFPRALPAVRAMVRAQQWLAAPDRFLPPGAPAAEGSLAPLELKVGMNVGPSLAINQNDRLDYFGTTVNLAARLCAQSRGTDLVLSEATMADQEVAQFLQAAAATLSVEAAPLKGLGETPLRFGRLQSGQVPGLRGAGEA